MTRYLDERMSYVTHNGYSLCEFFITSRVPQESNLGPELFDVFIDDLLNSLTYLLLAYFDDIKIFSEVMLQLSLDNIASWCKHYRSYSDDVR